MDRRIVYPGQIPYETDILLSNKFAMLGVSYLAQAIFGSSPIQVSGLNCTPDPDPQHPFRVVVSPGQVYAMAPIDATSYGGAVDADITHQVKKQGVLADPVTFDCPKPPIGKSIYYLIEVAFQEVDEEPATLLYYNADNPAIPFTGPGNNGQQQNTVRRGKCDVRLVTGIAADTGTEQIPAADPGYVGIWTVRVSGNTVNITAAPNATSDGIWMVNSGIRINIGGGGGGLDQETADGRYAVKAFANTFTNQNTFTFNNPTPIIVSGGQTSAGTGIKIIGDGVTTPSKTIRVRGGVFGIQNHVQSATDILTLDDGGNLEVSGRMSCSHPSGSDDSEVVTVGWANNRFALTGEGGFITQNDADGRYVRKDVGAPNPQTIATQLNVENQSGYSYGDLPANHVATAGWVRANFAQLALSGITKEVADTLYVRLDSADQNIAGIKTFLQSVRRNTNPSGLDNGELIPLGFADNRYARLNQANTFTTLTLTSAPTDGQHAVRKSYVDGTFLKSDGGGGTQNLTNGTFNAQSATFLVADGAAGTKQAVNRSQVDALINQAIGGTGNFARKDQANIFTQQNTFSAQVTFTGGATFQNAAPSCSVNPMGANDLVRLQYLQDQYVSKAGGTFTGNINVPNGTSGQHAVNWNQVFGTGGVAIKAQNNVFTLGQDINPPSGYALRVNSPSGIHRLTLGNFDVEVNAIGFQVKVGGSTMFTVNGVGTVVAGTSLTVGNNGQGTLTAGAGNFSGAVAAGMPNGSTSVPRLTDFVSGLGTTGRIDIPIWTGGQMRKMRIQWGRATLAAGFGISFAKFNWPAPFASGAGYHVQCTPDLVPNNNQKIGVYATNCTANTVDIYGNDNATIGVWVLGIGLAPVGS